MNKLLSNARNGLFLVVFAASVTSADEKPAEDAAQPIPEPVTFVTEHRGNFNGQRIDYTVTAGELYLKDKDGKPKASFFSFAYVAKNAGENRPVTFVWNGGPGSSSVWLHIGTLGPKRISVPSNAERAGLPPFDVRNAPETVLDVTDLVFVDPVGTGFSRPLGKHEGKEFWGLVEDATSVSAFIREWITVNNRWNSPKFLLGESFGTTRAAKVALMLEDDMNIGLNGIVFVSQALDYQGSTPYVDHNLVSFVTYLPTMAAAAHHHGRVNPVPESLEQFMIDARAFATDELLPALWKGNTISDSEARSVSDRLSYFLGISTDYIDRANLRVDGRRFAKELLRDQGLAVGIADARYTRDDIDDHAAEPESDASSDALAAPFTSAMMSYLRSDLNVTLERTYHVSGMDGLSRQWRWRPVSDDQGWEPTYVNTAPDLSEVLRKNPSLKVLVASGYHDLVTPFFDAEYTINRHGINADQVQYTYYVGGHMMYVHEPSRTELLADIRAFIDAQTKTN
ncbi:MAG: serine carboxypeptidase [Pseudomonadota bacterium]